MHPDLWGVMIEKRHDGLKVDGVILVKAQVQFNGAPVEMACTEGELHTATKQVVEGQGIAALPDTNSLRAAKRVVDLT